MKQIWSTFVQSGRSLGAWLHKQDTRFPLVKTIVVVLLFLLYIGACGEQTFWSYFELSKQHQEIQKEYEQELQNYKVDSLRITHSKGGAAEIERLARERYYMKEAGEDIYLVSPDSLPSDQ